MTYSTIRYFPQDPRTTQPFTVNVPNRVFGKELQGDRVQTVDGSPLAQPQEVYEPDSREFAQLNSHYISHLTLELAESYLGAPINWGSQHKKLTVHPHSQPGKNAYYQSKPVPSVNHMYFRVPEDSKTVRTALSADIISHEVGHAILDGIRPELVQNPDTEALALHEAFGDCMSMLFTLSQSTSRGYLLYQTGGDLRQESLLSSWAEELGGELNRYQENGAAYIRSHVHNYRYRRPEELPSPSPGKPGKGLDNGPHRFSQVFSGAFFDLLVSLYEKGVDRGKTSLEAMDWAQQQAGPLLLKSAQKLDEKNVSFRGLAQGMLKVDEELGGDNREILLSVFADRELNSVDMPDWSAREFKDFYRDGRLTGSVHRTSVSGAEAEEMKAWIESHLDFLKSWDKNDGQRDFEVKNPSFWGAYGGDKNHGSTNLWDHKDYVERARFSDQDVSLVGFNRDGRGWYFHYDRGEPDRSFREFRKNGSLSDLAGSRFFEPRCGHENNIILT